MNEQNQTAPAKPQAAAAPKPEPKVFQTIDGNSLMAQEYEPLQFSIEKILPHGLFIFAGSPKVGKSWLTLDMCQAVSTGGKLWDFTATPGEVLYLALEDKFSRLQGRLKQMKADHQDISRLHLTTASFGIENGLLEQIHNFIAAYPATNLIAIDTLERIRDGERDRDIYSCDYSDMTKLREITDKHKVTLILIHHTRKMYDPDPLNTVSGSTGLVGAVDGAFVLIKNKRTGNNAKLTISNRDTKGFCFELRFDEETCRWDYMGSSSEDSEDEDALGFLLNDFLQEDWSGTATELCNELKSRNANFTLSPATLAKQLNASSTLLKKDYSIAFERDRNSKAKRIFLRRIEN
jgi:archaellum biogenesis ATPase FlaH